jgi:hypothetical protein
VINQELQELHEAVLAMTDISNVDMPAARTVSHGSALAVMRRSLARTDELPMSVRSHLAFRDLSDFISMSQKSKSNLTRPLNTDLLPIGNPMSTAPSAMTAAAFRYAEARWIASDPRITDDEARTVLTASLAAAPFSDERAYYSTRLSALPAGVIPLEALVAGLGDGNSTAARRARAQKQLRDSEGKWIFMGGGLRVLVRRANGSVNSFSGRAIAAGDGINDMSVDMEIGNGRIARVPAASAVSSKAYLPNQQTPDGFATTPAKYSASDPVINEADIQYVDSPHGFDQDPNYEGPGTRYSDGYYSVTKFEAGDPNTPENTGTDPSQPTFAVARVNDDGSDEAPLGYADNWSGAQDGIRADQPKRDEEEGRPEDPVARLDGPPTAQEPQAAPRRGRQQPVAQPEATPEATPVGELPEDAPEDIPLDEDIEPIDIPEDVTPQADINPNADVDSQMEYDVPTDSYAIDPNANYIPKGRRNEEAEDYTDDPAALAQIYNAGELTSALEEALTPQGDSAATGKGELSFDGGDEMVPAEALSKALQLVGGDPHAEIARIYDGLNGNGSNSDRLATLRGEEVPVAEIPEETPAPGLQLADLPEAMQGMSDAEFQKYLEDGDYTPFLLENIDLDMPEGYSYLDLEPGEPATDEDRAAAGLPDAVNTNPVTIAMDYDKDDLLEQLRAAVEPNTDNPGYGQLLFDDGSEDGYAATVPAEILRDALQLQGVDTNGFLQQIADDGFAGQEADIDESEAGKILAELDGTPEDMAPAGQEIDRYELSQLAADMGVGRDVRDAILDGEDIEDILLKLDFDPAYQEAKQDYDTRMDVDMPRAVQRAQWSLFERFQKALNPQPAAETPVANIPEPDSALDPMPEGPPDNPRQNFSPNQHWMWVERNAFIPGDTDRWVLTPRGQEVKDRLGAEAAPENTLTPEEKAVLDDIIKDIPGLDVKVAEDALTYDEWADMPERTNEPDDMPEGSPVLDEAVASLEAAASAAGVDVPEVPQDDQNPQMAKVLAAMQAMQAELNRLQAEVVELRANQQAVPEETSSRAAEISNVIEAAAPSLNSLELMQIEFEVLDNHGAPRPAFLPDNAFAIEPVTQNGTDYIIYAVPRTDEFGYEIRVHNVDTGEDAVYNDNPSNRPTSVEDLVKTIRDSVMWSDSSDYNLDALAWETAPARVVPSYLQLPGDAFGIMEHVLSANDGNYYAVYARPNGDGTFGIYLRREDDGSVAFIRDTDSNQEAADTAEMIADDLTFDNFDPNYYSFVNPEGVNQPGNANNPETPMATWERELLEPAPEGMFQAIRPVVGADGKNYEVEIHVNGDGKYAVSVRDEAGNTVDVGVFDDAAAANIQQNHMANLVEQNADLNIQQMIRDANRDRGAAEEGVNPHIMPERRGEGGEGRIRGRGRRAANGANNDTPMIPILDKMRDRVRAIRNNAAMQRARSQMKKYFSGWDTRGNNHPRPTHEIQSREVRPDHFDAKYTDMNGNVIRNGDIVVHNRAGEMVNPDWEAVNLIKGRVVDRGSIWRNGKRHDGYLTIEVIDSDNDDWNGRFFTYKSNMVEIIEQPDLKGAVEAEIARRGASAMELFHQTLWASDDKGLHQIWNAWQYQPENDPYRVELEREMYKRWLVPPKGMADYLNWVSDEGLAAIPDDIAMQEGFNGLVLRRLVAHERARRAAGSRPTDPMGPLPMDIFEEPAPGEAIEFHPNLRPENPNPPVNPNPGGRAPMAQPIARPRRMPPRRPVRPARPAQPAPIPQNANPVPARPAAPEAAAPPPPSGPPPFNGGVGELPPIDSRMVVERFIPADGSGMGTAGNIAGDPNTAGITVPAGGTDIHPDAVNPNASQLDYVEMGWADQRAAEIAEAARTRMSTKALVDLITRKEGIRKGDIVPNDPGEILDLETRIQRGVRDIYGDTGILGGDVKIDLSHVEVYYQYGSDEIHISLRGRLSGPDGVSGSLSRDLYLNTSGDNSKSHAHNSIFTLKDKNGDTLKGAGVSDPYNRWMENWYAANGIAYVDVEAHGLPGSDAWVGGARWALNGFQWQETRSAMRHLEGLEDHIFGLRGGGADPKVIKRAEKDLERLKKLMEPYDEWERAGRIGPAPAVPSPLKFVMVGWRPGMFKNWTGWNYMSDVIWNGKKDIKPDTSNTREMVGYEDVYRVSRERIKAQQNVFQGSPEFINMFGPEDFYADPAQHIIAPYRDEIAPFFTAGAPLSLARLSPPARQSLQVWAARFVETDTSAQHAQDSMRLLNQLRDEAAAYDSTPSDLGPHEAVLVQVTPEDLRRAGVSGGFIKVGGQIDTKFIAKRLGQGEELPGGIMETYLVTDTETGQKFFLKTGGADVMKNEENMNALARAFGMRGASVVKRNQAGNVVINTHAGHGVRGASSPNLAGTTQKAYEAARSGITLGLSQGMVDFMRKAPVETDMQKALDNDPKWKEITGRYNMGMGVPGGLSPEERNAYNDVVGWVAALRHRNSRHTGVPATGGAADAPARMDDVSISADRIGLADLTAMALLDAVAHNTDRHDSNWLIADVGAPTQADGTELAGRERFVPLAIDHGFSGINDPRYLNAVDNDLTQNGPGSSAIRLWAERMNRLSIEHRVAAVRLSAQTALDRMSSLRPAGMSDMIYDTVIERLQTLVSMSDTDLARLRA